MSKKIFKSIIISLIILFSAFYPTQAQQDEYRLNISRTFGYGNGSEIRGTFTLGIVGPGNMRSVRYMIDDQLINEISSDPFVYSFQTTQYSPGWHDLSAVVETNDGRKITTPVRRFNFVTAEQQTSGFAGIIIPLLGGIALVMVGVVVFQSIAFRRKPLSTLPLGASRNYGLRGGTICPHCRRPFSIHWWAMNIGFRNRVDRCDYCGKWSIVRPYHRADLDAAESAELEQAQSGPLVSTKTEQDRLKEMIDKSRYTDQ